MQQHYFVRSLAIALIFSLSLQGQPLQLEKVEPNLFQKAIYAATAAGMYLLRKKIVESPRLMSNQEQKPHALEEIEEIGSNVQPKTKRLQDLPTRLATIGTYGLVFGGTFLLLPPVYFSALLIFILLFILKKEWPQFPGKIKAITPAYPVLPFLLLTYLNQNPEYHNLLHYLFAMVFANDGGAYLAGSLLGKTRVVPSISPNKSWEGIAGGFCLSTAALTAMLLMSKQPLSLKLLPFSLLVTAVSTSGDLFESWLKRKADIKDTGTLLPGHGGLLDRFDSIMAVSLLFFALKNQLTPLLLTDG